MATKSYRRLVGIIYVQECREDVSYLKIGGLNPLDFFISSFFHAVTDSVPVVSIIFSSTHCNNIMSKSSNYIQNRMVNVIDQSMRSDEYSHIINSPPMNEERTERNSDLYIFFSLKYYPVWKNDYFELSTFLNWVARDQHYEHPLVISSPNHPSSTMAVVSNSDLNSSIPFLKWPSSLSSVQDFITSHPRINSRTVTAPMDFTFIDLSNTESVELLNEMHCSSFEKISLSFPPIVREKCPARVGLMVLIKYVYECINICWNGKFVFHEDNRSVTIMFSKLHYQHI